MYVVNMMNILCYSKKFPNYTIRKEVKRNVLSYIKCKNYIVCTFKFRRR